MRTVALLLSLLLISALTIGCIQPATSPAPTAVATVAPVKIPANIADPTPVSAVAPEQIPHSQSAVVSISQLLTNSSAKGVWVRIGTEGRYTGTIGTEGSFQEVNGTGEHFYQVPAASTDIVEIYIRNLDTYGRVMSVEVFNNGEMIERNTISSPGGTVVMGVNLKTAQLPKQTRQVTTPVTLVQPTPAGQGSYQIRQTVTLVTKPQVVSLSCNPQQESVTVFKRIEMRDLEISNCAMGVLLPDIVGNPTYGLNGSRNSRLTGFSDGDYKRVLRESKEKQGAINYCVGVIPTPYWNWIECKAVLQQSGYQPERYEVTFYANYESLKIPVRSSVDTFKPGQQYPYMVYIPIKADQVGDITNFEFGFVHTAP